MSHGPSEGDRFLHVIDENAESVARDLCYPESDVRASGMAEDVDRAKILRLANEVRHFVEAPGQNEEVKSLLRRCYRVLSRWPDSVSTTFDQGQELENVARVLEAEPVLWPEDEERMRSLADRVRQWISRQ